jgi:hypothetical protein
MTAPGNILIGRGDNAPVIRWAMPFDTTGSDFELTYQTPEFASSAYSVAFGGVSRESEINDNETQYHVVWD